MPSRHPVEEAWLMPSLQPLRTVLLPGIGSAIRAFARSSVCSILVLVDQARQSCIVQHQLLLKLGGYRPVVGLAKVFLRKSVTRYGAFVARTTRTDCARAHTNNRQSQNERYGYPVLFQCLHSFQRPNASAMRLFA